MERMVNRRLVQVLVERKWVQKKPVHNRCTKYIKHTHHRSYTQERILSNDIYIYIDVSRAYDTCWRRGILNLLKTWKINGRMLGFAENFMSNRTLRVENMLSSPMSIKNGVVQGVTG
jgi:hypothetical protein